MMVLVMTVITGFVYTFAFTGVAQLVFPSNADGSMVSVDGKVVGSEAHRPGVGRQAGEPTPAVLPVPTVGGHQHDRRRVRPVAQPRIQPRADQPVLRDRPEEPCLDDHGKEIPPVVVQHVRDYRKLNGLSANAKVPVDAVTASGSGLDPQISVANARLQAARVAGERRLPVKQVLSLIDDHTDARPLGVLGEAGVNVLELNLALDRVAPLTP